MATAKLYAEDYAKAVGTAFPQFPQEYETERHFWHLI